MKDLKFDLEKMIELYGYDKLIESFLENKISTEEFETSYRKKFLKENNDLTEDAFLLLDELFVYVYGYTKDIELLKLYPDSHFTEEQLCESAAKTLQELRALNE